MIKKSKDDIVINLHTAAFNKKLNEGKVFKPHEDLSLFYTKSQLKYVIVEITKPNFKPAKPGLTHFLFQRRWETTGFNIIDEIVKDGRKYFEDKITPNFFKTTAPLVAI